MTRKKDKSRNKNKNKGAITMNMTPQRTNASTQSYYCCHKPTEIYTGLWLLKESQFEDISVSKNIDIAVPLLTVDERIWRGGWNGVVYAVPVADYGTLTRSVERKKVLEIVEFIKNGLKVAIFCMGGHGRTGYIASLVLWELGVSNPIEYIREHYCKNTVESNEQVLAIADFTGDKSILNTKIPSKSYGGYGSAYNLDEWYKGKCKTCKYFTMSTTHSWTGTCSIDEVTTDTKPWGKCERIIVEMPIGETNTPEEVCSNCGYYINNTYCEYNIMFTSNNATCADFFIKR